MKVKKNLTFCKETSPVSLCDIKVMHGAYDLSLTRSTEDREIDQPRNLIKLPKSLRYANDHFRASNPWPRNLLPGDFILIAEFSEQEGPKPVVSK